MLLIYLFFFNLFSDHEAAAGIVVAHAQGRDPDPRAAIAIARSPTAAVARDHAQTARAQEESHAPTASPRRGQETAARNRGKIYNNNN